MKWPKATKNDGAVHQRIHINIVDVVMQESWQRVGNML